MKPTSFDQMLASALLEMTIEPTLPATLDRVVALVVEMVESCDAAAVVLMDDHAFATVVASDETLRDLMVDHAVLDSALAWTVHRRQEPVRSDDLTLDFRWPVMGEELRRRLGIQSLYALPLTRSGKPLGVLLAFAKTTGAFDEEEQETARILAIHATAQVADAVEHEQLERALSSRTVIGQATGIVMERYGLDSVKAFGVLRRLSQTENVKLREIAAQVVDSGQAD
jgi:GAF domain-containing protein